MKKTFLILAASLSTIAVAHADPLVVELNQKVQYLEEQNRDLRGMVEELTHASRVLNQKFETFSSDIEMRLSNQSAATGPASGPLALTDGDRPQPSILKDPSVAQAPTALAPQADPNLQTAVLPDQAQSLNPKQQYEHARSLLEQGDYTQAGNKFAEFVHNHPQNAKVPDANYWLGVSYLVRGQYESAAGTFAQLYKAYPSSKKAPDALIKMAKSLSALGRKGDACMTLTQFKQEFPGKLESQYQQEWTQLGCE